jgi:hypothetical protein
MIIQSAIDEREISRTVLRDYCVSQVGMRVSEIPHSHVTSAQLLVGDTDLSRNSGGLDIPFTSTVHDGIVRKVPCGPEDPDRWRLE